MKAAAAAARREWNSDPYRDKLIADIDGAILAAGHAELQQYIDMDECCSQAQMAMDAGVKRAKAISNAVAAAAIAAAPVKAAALAHQKALMKRDLSNKKLLAQQAAEQEEARRAAEEEEARLAAEEAARTHAALEAARQQALMAYYMPQPQTTEYQTLADEEQAEEPPMPPPVPVPRARWYWEEDAHNVSKHRAQDHKVTCKDRMAALHAHSPSDLTPMCPPAGQLHRVFGVCLRGARPEAPRVDPVGQ